MFKRISLWFIMFDNWLHRGVPLAQWEKDVFLGKPVSFTEIYNKEE